MTKNPLSLMVFDRDQSPRKEAIAIMNNKNFNNLIFVSIIVSWLLCTTRWTRPRTRR